MLNHYIANQGDNIAIMADSCLEWIVALEAAFAYSLVVVPIYPTHGTYGNVY